MNDFLKDLLVIFGVEPGPCSIAPIGSGHIHETFLVERCGEDHPPMVLQKMNHSVYQDIDVLMKNMELVTAHIALKNRHKGIDPAKYGIVLLETDEGDSWIGSDELGYWRMFWFIENQMSYETAENVNLAFEGGKAIAEFQEMLIDIDLELIEDTIPNFLDLKVRLEQFEASLKSASNERKELGKQLIDISQMHSARMLELFDFSGQNNVATRITHNDTKFSNILFGKDEKVTCMIDLDTVMKGYSWFDFGNALRTCASAAPEDEVDIDKIEFRMEIFEAFAKGFISKGKTYLREDEVSILHRTPALFCYMQGVGFLTDFLKNELCADTKLPDHNYQGARAQFTLMSRMMENEKQMSSIIENAWNSENI